MLLKGWLSLLLILSLSSCENGPKVVVHISNPQQGGMEYSNADGSLSGFKLYAQTENFVCLSPSDAQSYLTYCQRKCKK